MIAFSWLLARVAAKDFAELAKHDCRKRLCVTKIATTNQSIRFMFAHVCVCAEWTRGVRICAEGMRTPFDALMYAPRLDT